MGQNDTDFVTPDGHIFSRRLGPDPGVGDVGSVDLDGAPADVLGVEDLWQDTLGRFNRQQHCGVEQEAGCCGFEVQQVEARVALGQLGDHRNCRPRVGQTDGLGQRQQVPYRCRLVTGIETEKRAREVSLCSAGGGTAGTIVPRRRGVALAVLVEADEQVFDEEPVVEDDRGYGGHLLIGDIWVLDAGEAGLVAVSEYVAEFAARGLYAARDDQGGIAEIDDPYFAAVFETPPVAKLGRQIGLAAVGYLGR